MPSLRSLGHPSGFAALRPSCQKPLARFARTQSRSPARAKELGLDVEAWLKAGWIDAVIAGNGFTFGSNALDQWVTLAHRHRVPVCGVIERMPRGFTRYGSPETLRAAAATLWARGADGL